MNRLVLLAETPRAGRLGHRFLAPDNALDLSESDITAVFQAVEKSGFVSDSGISEAIDRQRIAVRRTVAQKLDHSNRDGHETLVLDGIDTEQLSKEAVRSIVDKLRIRLGDLESLVQSTDWARIRSGSLVVPRKELTEWLTEFQKLVPSRRIRSEREERIRPEREERRDVAPRPGMSFFRWLLLTCVLLLVFAAGMFLGRFADLDRFAPPTAAREAPVVASADVRRADRDAADRGGDLPIDAGRAKPSEAPETAPPQPVSADEEAKPKQPESTSSALLLDLIRNALRVEDINVLLFLVAYLPRDAAIPPPLADELLAKCKTLLASGEFESAFRLADQVLSLGPALPQDSLFLAELDDCKRKADPDAADRNLYQQFLGAHFPEKRESARAYLQKAPRKYMADAVQCWLDWADGPLVIEIDFGRLPRGRSYEIRFQANDAEAFVISAPAAAQPSFLRRRFDLSRLGIVKNGLPLQLYVSALEIGDAQSPQRRWHGSLDLGQLAGPGNIELAPAMPRGSPSFRPPFAAVNENNQPIFVPFDIPPDRREPILPIWEKKADERAPSHH